MINNKGRIPKLYPLYLFLSLLITTALFNNCSPAFKALKYQALNLSSSDSNPSSPTPVPSITPQPAIADLRSFMGGTLTNWVSSPDQWNPQIAAAKNAGGRVMRIALLPPNYYDDSKNSTTESSIDSLVQDVFAAGITPIVLFEFNVQMNLPYGGYSKWFSIGKAFAQRFGPKGIKHFEAFNEPDLNGHIPATPEGLKAYHDCLSGLADGVHSVDPTLKVTPGGYALPNSSLNFTGNGFISSVADLFNSGSLNGIDLHVYYGDQYFPPTAGHYFSAQNLFEQVKRASGITADIDFYSTEFNYGLGGSIYQTSTPMDEAYATKRFLTVLWDLVGIVKNDKTPATKLALVWNLTQVEEPYTIGLLGTPWTPTSRGQLLKEILAMTNDMTIESSDPNGTGVIILKSNTKKMWVWQNLTSWSAVAGTSFTVTDIPATATSLDIYGWDGLRKTVALTGASEITISDLPTQETILFIAD